MRQIHTAADFLSDTGGGNTGQGSVAPDIGRLTDAGLATLEATGKKRLQIDGIISKRQCICFKMVDEKVQILMGLADSWRQHIEEIVGAGAGLAVFEQIVTGGLWRLVQRG